jgi:hypothetical protein
MTYRFNFHEATALKKKLHRTGTDQVAELSPAENRFCSKWAVSFGF